MPTAGARVRADPRVPSITPLVKVISRRPGSVYSRAMSHTRLIALLLSILLPLQPSAAQDRTGRDTPGEWIVDHHARFGQWDSMCDHRDGSETREERCYIRYVDVFSPRPAFAAQFVFVTPGPRIEFGIEPGTLFRMDGFRIERGGEIAWSAPMHGCLGGMACIYEGKPAEWLLGQMTAGGVFIFQFTDRHGTPQTLTWDLGPFAAARADFEAQAAARGH